MIHEQKIPCPVCKTHIPFDPFELLKGVKFSCPSCFAQIGIANESVDLAKNTMERFQALKSSMGQKNKK